MRRQLRGLHPLFVSEVTAMEIDRSLYMDQKTLEKPPGFDRLKADLDRLIAAVADYVRTRL